MLFQSNVTLQKEQKNIIIILNVIPVKRFLRITDRNRHFKVTLETW